MMRIIIPVLILFVLLLSTPVAAQVGVDCSSGSYSGTEFCQNQAASGENPVDSILQTVIDVMTVIAGVVAVIGVIIGGYQLAVGGGNPESVARGRRTIIYSIVGVIIVILARVIIVFVLSSL